MGVWLPPEPNNNLKWCPVFIDHYRGTVSFDTGLLEVTAKMPEGKGLWPVIWLLGDIQTEII